MPEKLHHAVNQLLETLTVALEGKLHTSGQVSSVDPGAAFAQLAEQALAQGWVDVERLARQLSQQLEGWPADRPLLAVLELIEADLQQLAYALRAHGVPATRLEQLAKGQLREEDQGAASSARPAEPTSLSADPELLQDFVVEAREHLDQIEAEALILEREPHNRESLHTTFRAFHTLKGLAGFLELDPVRTVAHELETALATVRDRGLSASLELTDVILKASDYIKAIVQEIDQRLKGNPAKPFPSPDGVLAEVYRLQQALQEAGTGEPTQNLASALPQPGAQVTSFPASGSGHEAVPTSLAADVSAETQFVKISTAKLDYLVDMVGELVVAQSLLENVLEARANQNPQLLRCMSQLARITGEVQRTAMSMRMVPVGILFRRMARLVRDLARKEGKKVELVTAGDDTELDRNIVEALADPLLHMVRNAIGHGIETPEERRAAGKPEIGQIRLAASHQAGFIQIELSDDGRGLQKQKILARARALGLVGPEAELSEAEIHNLIFQPGFSTATEVSDVSGRGVGMDVVKRNVAKLRGRVEVYSTEGQGTTFVLKLPLTLAIIEGLIVCVGQERYVIPIYAVREMFRPTPEMLSSLHGKGEMVLVRGRLLPLVRLHAIFGVQPRTTDPTQALVLVTESLGQPFCLMVDELMGKQEVVIKSLGQALSQLPGFSGGAILGDGRVGLILDVENLFRTTTRHAAAA